MTAGGPHEEHTDASAPEGAEPGREEVDFHPADLTADQAGAVRREAEARAAGEQPAPDDAGSAAPQEEVAPGDALSPEAAALAATRAQVDELTADLKRAQAEFVNYKRRVERDRELVKQNATFAALTSLLPVLDDIDRAREHGEVEGGFKAVADSLDRAVASLGLDRFGAPGDEFDPTLHEALMHGHSAEVTTTTVDKVVQAGYRIGERVVRAARVTVLDPEA